MFAAFPIHDDVRCEFVSSEFCVRLSRAMQKPNYFLSMSRGFCQSRIWSKVDAAIMNVMYLCIFFYNFVIEMN